jgi:hypothetical protein
MDPLLVSTTTQSPVPDHFPAWAKKLCPFTNSLPQTTAPAVVVLGEVLVSDNFHTPHAVDQPVPAPELPPATVAFTSVEVPIHTQYALGATVIVDSGSPYPVPNITHHTRLSPFGLKDTTKFFGGHPDNNVIVLDIPPAINIMAPRCTRRATRLASFNYPPPYLGESDDDPDFGPNTLLSSPADDHFAFTRFKPKPSITKLPSSANRFKSIRIPVRLTVPDHPPDLLSSSSDDATDHIRSVGIPVRRRRRRRN